MPPVAQWGGAFPCTPVRSMASQPEPQPDLPVQLTSFVGREPELAEVGELLRTSRLLTLTGSGGSGKTRLAVEVARDIAGEFPGGTAWVELAGLSDPDLVAQQVASALGIRDERAGSSTAALLEVLRERSTLVVLDNCEHLVDAVAQFVALLLRGCPRLTVLATSREPLGVDGERAWLVPPLSFPDSAAAPSTADLERFEAVKLFTLRAREASREFVLTAENALAVIEICRRLDGLPLAVELAAARVGALSPVQIAARLDRAFDLLTGGPRTSLPRHRTLRATLDWSYGLLSAPEEELLRRLSVFTGGFTLEAAEDVCGGGEIPESEVLDLLASLVDRSLVGVRELEEVVRYELQETVRQYAEEKRRTIHVEQDAPELRRRHAEHYLRLAEAAHPALEGYQGFNEWLPRLTVEQDNLRSALAWSLQNEPALALRLVGHLPYFWVPQPVHWGEGLRWTEAALEQTPSSIPDLILAKAVWAAGLLAILRQDWSRAREYVDEAIDLARRTGDDRLQVLSLGVSPTIAAVQGDLELARSHAEEAVRIAREQDDPWLTAVALITGVAPARRAEGGPEAAEPALREALEVAQREGFAWCIWEAAMSLCVANLERDDLDEASTLVRTAARAADQLGVDWHAARVVVVLAAVLTAQGEQRIGARLLGSVESWLQGVGARLFPAEELLYQRLTADLRRSLGDEGLREAVDEGRGVALAESLSFGWRDGGDPGARRPTAVQKPDSLAGVSDSIRVEGAIIRVEGAVSGAPWLEVAALGPLRIVLDGQPLDPTGWTHAKPRELLMYLLAHPEGRTRDQIGLAFWPEASAAQVKNNFHVLLHKLRKALGRPEAVLAQGQRYRISPEVDVWFDLHVFEQEIGDALRRAPADGGSAEALETALALYRGDFLEGELAGDWHLEIHDHARRLFVDGLSALADLQIGHEDLAGAVDTLERLVTKEDLREEAYRRLMICLARGGRRDRALRHHDRLVRLLRDELDVEPEPETDALAAQIREAVPV